MMLLVVSQAFAKACVTQFVLALRPQRKIVWLCRGIIAAISLWVITGIGAFAGQCHSPKPWLTAPGRCVNQRALQLYIGIMNIATDVALVVVPIYMVSLLSNIARLPVIALFSIRIVVPVFSVLSLVWLPSPFSTSDLTWDIVTFTIWLQVVLNLSIITACIPSLRPLLNAFGSGATALGIAPIYEGDAQNRSALGWFRARRAGSRHGHSHGSDGSRSCCTADGPREILRRCTSAPEVRAQNVEKQNGLEAIPRTP